MAVRKIYGFEHPMLRAKSKKAPKVDASIVKLIDDLAETMLAAPGAGAWPRRRSVFLSGSSSSGVTRTR